MGRPYEVTLEWTAVDNILVKYEAVIMTVSITARIYLPELVDKFRHESQPSIACITPHLNLPKEYLRLNNNLSQIQTDHLATVFSCVLFILYNCIAIIPDQRRPKF